MPETDDRSLWDAALVGARRATGHFVRAGVEVLWGVGALVDELRRHGGADEPGPESIPLDDDEASAPDPEPQKITLDDPDGEPDV